MPKNVGSVEPGVCTRNWAGGCHLCPAVVLLVRISSGLRQTGRDKSDALPCSLRAPAFWAREPGGNQRHFEPVQHPEQAEDAAAQVVRDGGLVCADRPVLNVNPGGN